MELRLKIRRGVVRDAFESQKRFCYLYANARIAIIIRAPGILMHSQLHLDVYCVFWVYVNTQKKKINTIKMHRYSGPNNNDTIKYFEYIVYDFYYTRVRFLFFISTRVVVPISSQILSRNCIGFTIKLFGTTGRWFRSFKRPLCWPETKLNTSLNADNTTPMEK